jgi:hypothetical protein
VIALGGLPFHRSSIAWRIFFSAGVIFFSVSPVVASSSTAAL